MNLGLVARQFQPPPAVNRERGQRGLALEPVTEIVQQRAALVPGCEDDVEQAIAGVGIGRRSGGEDR